MFHHMTKVFQLKYISFAFKSTFELHPYIFGLLHGCQSKHIKSTMKPESDRLEVRFNYTLKVQLQ